MRYECCKVQAVGDYPFCPEHGGDAVSARQEIDVWLARNPTSATRHEEEIVRAALEIIDAEHHEIAEDVMGPPECQCSRSWCCKVKAEHEARLWEVIRG